MPARKSVKASPAGEELGLELLQSVREMKARKIARVTQVQLNEVVEARQSTGVSQAVCASALGISKRTLKEWGQGHRSHSGAAQALIRIPRKPISTKSAEYKALVVSRKACRKCADIGLTNPACVQAGAFDGPDIGPWTRWNGDLNARVLVVGQEWGDVASLVRQGGLDTASPTNRVLRELLASVGVRIRPAPLRASRSGVFLTNAALCLKDGGAQAPVRAEWFANCADAYLRRQIELVRPAVVVTLGERAYLAVRQAFNLRRVSFRHAANKFAHIPLPNGSQLVPVYHCGQRILNTHRRREAQFNDWLRVKALLTATSA
ncbi:MAG: hypothetical protein IPG91_16595 [Ideonella sp.]|nr:hypothetical protein [Ideonella sp.]